MGGAIGLRALHDGLPVQAAAFSGPMWGIQMTPFLKSIAGIVLGLAGPFGFGTTFAPTTGPWQPMEFDDNPLTTDRDEFDYMSARSPHIRNWRWAVRRSCGSRQPWRRRPPS
jgi:lysophospholipase